MPVGQRAAPGARREVGPQPLLLSGAGGHADAAVQRNDVPIAEVVAVVSPAGRTRVGAEVGIVWGGARRVVLVVPRRRTRARLVPAPGRLIAVREVGSGPI